MSNEKMVIDPSDIEKMQQKHNVQPIKAINIADYKSIPFSELKTMVPPPIEYVFFPCLPTQGIAFIYAATGIGKTLFALNMAYAIAGGGSFLKYTCPKPRKVLYVDGEMPFNQVHARLMQIAERQGELDFEDNLCLLTPDKILPHRMPKIDDCDGQYIYKEILLTQEFEVIVLDNLSMLSSLDENKSQEWKSVQDWLLHLRSLGKTVIVVHHSGKDKNGYRGTSRMLDCVDTAISLQPVNEDAIEEDNTAAKKFKVVYQKARLFGGKDALPFEATLENGFWSHRSMELTQMDKIVELMGMKMTQRDIAKDMAISLSKVNRLVRKARHLRLLKD